MATSLAILEAPDPTHAQFEEFVWESDERHFLLQVASLYGMKSAHVLPYT